MNIANLTAAAATAAAILGASQGSAFIPEPCATSPSPPPSWFECPVPYVEMVLDGTDRIFERAWYCPQTDYALGLVVDPLGAVEDGCGGSAGLGMFGEWSVPAASAPGHITEAQFKEGVLQLFDRFLVQMRHPGPPDTEWVADMRTLLAVEVEGGVASKCFAIPHDLRSNGVVCGTHLAVLLSAAAFEDYFDRDDLIRQFWLAKICHENPDVCPEL